MLSIYTWGYFWPAYIHHSDVSVPAGSGRHNEVNGVDEISTRIRTSMISPLGTFIDRSANWMVTRVGRSSPNPSCWYTERGSKLILAPRSRSAQLISVCPMVQEIVGHSGSLYLTGMGPDRSLLMLVAKNTFYGTFIFLFLVHISFRNLAYAETYWLASRRDTLNLTLLNSSIFSMCMFLLLFLKPTWKGCCRLVNLISSCVFLRRL